MFHIFNNTNLVSITEEHNHKGKHSVGNTVEENGHLTLPFKASDTFVFNSLCLGELRGFMSWTESFGGGTDGWDSVSRNLTKSSEKD